jgi:hypothetical protein
MRSAGASRHWSSGSKTLSPSTTLTGQIRWTSVGYVIEGALKWNDIARA